MRTAKTSYYMHDGRSGLFKAALEEFQVTRQIATGNGERYLNLCGVDGESVPGWFVREELGHDGPVGFRLQAMTPQEVLDDRHQRSQRAEDAPRPAPSDAEVKAARRGKKQREDKWSRRRRHENVEVQAMLMRRHAV